MLRLVTILTLTAVVGLVLAAFKPGLTNLATSWQQRHEVQQDELLSETYLAQILNSSGEVDTEAKKGLWHNQEVASPITDWGALLKGFSGAVLGEYTEEKWIYVDLTTQTLSAYEGNKLIYHFPISSGNPWTPTVTGEFRIWAKLLSQRMSGGSISDGSYYNLPNVPYVQYFHGGYGIHGAYWHNDFGFPRSHGCVNLSVSDAGTLFAWTNPVLSENKSALFNIDPSQSTRVVVRGTTPTRLN